MELSRTKEYRKKYYFKNREKLAERARQWRKNNPEKVKQARKKYNHSHPEKVKEWRRNYLARPYGKNAYKVRQRAYDNRKRRELIQEMGGKCIRCGFDDWRALQIDHINGGGTNDNKIMRNYSPLNRSKEVLMNKSIKYNYFVLIVTGLKDMRKEK